MSVPPEVRAVDRPRNTVVVDRGSGEKRYAVLQRSGIVYREGKSSSPRNGKTIGHIINLVYRPNGQVPGSCGASFLSWGVATLVMKVLADVVEELLMIWDVSAVWAIMALVAIRVKKPKVPLMKVGSLFRNSYASVYWKGASVSKNSLTKLLEGIGMDTLKRRQFFRNHIANCGAGHILVDGTLKQDSSRINDVSDYSYKSRVAGTLDVSLLYAYSVDKREPIASEVYPGNCPDMSAYAAFIEHNGIKEGVLIADKGLPVASISTLVSSNPKLHYLSPIRRNSLLIEAFGLLEFDTLIPSHGKNGVFGKKVETPDGRYLYSFKDVDRAAREVYSFSRSCFKNGQKQLSKLGRKEALFGVVVFISDLDMSLEDVYLAYSERWLLELVFDRYKSDLELDITRVQSNFSVNGNEFVNFLCILATCRIINVAGKAGLLDKRSYGDLMESLDDITRNVNAPCNVMPERGDGYWENPGFVNFDTLEKLSLVKPKEKTARQKAAELRQNEPETKAKRKPGRPRIHPLEPDKPKRPRGRPRKIRKPEDEKPKRPVGRPRIHPIKPEGPKRPRVKKSVDSQKSRDDFVGPRRPVGRPRIHPLEPNKPKRPRGRPRKVNP